MPSFGNFLTVKWQFSGGSDTDIVHHIFCQVVSPMKNVKPGPSIMDVEFAEEEDDVEYDPDKDSEVIIQDRDNTL